MNTWFEITGFLKKHCVKQMLAFMKGKAADFFMTFVVLDVKIWTVDSLGQALFNYCFLPAFHCQMQVKFNEYRQGKHPIKDYLCQLKSMAAHLPDITQFQLAQSYWDGAETYIHLKWMENSFMPEFSSLDQLEIAVECYENTEQLHTYELRCNNEDSLPTLQWSMEKGKGTVVRSPSTLDLGIPWDFRPSTLGLRPQCASVTLGHTLLLYLLLLCHVILSTFHPARISCDLSVTLSPLPVTHISI